MRAAVLSFAVLASGCARDPEPRLCPDVARGDFAVTEVRKASDTADPLGSWVEIVNTTSGTLDLRGMELRFRRKDGSSETDVTIRRSVPVAGGAYAVLGLFPDDDMLPAHIDYGFADDFSTAFPSAVALDVEACGEQIDRVSYDSLPSMGTYSLGAMPPNANDNDLPTKWCTDGTMSGTTYPGTPRAANTPCP